MSLTDAQWARIEPLLPDRTPKRGGRWRDQRQVIDASVSKHRTGTPWVDLPEHFGSWEGAPTTCCESGLQTTLGRRSSPRCSPRPTPRAI
ncbi:transposase [Streptomyces millisiae]|uniref:transposase n=1 Tax=Streptomyces millisiae TaxID=3075542 RepID=UPI00374DFFB4